MATSLEKAFCGSGKADFVKCIKTKQALEELRGSLETKIKLLLNLDKRTDEEATLLLQLFTQLNTLDAELGAISHELMTY